MSLPARRTGLSTARRCWFRWQLHRRVAEANLQSLLQIGRLPADLVSSQGHDTLLVHYRMRSLSTRVGAMLMFLAIATLAWIPIDVALFNTNWSVVVPLACGRVVTAAAFMAIGSAQARGSCQHQPIEALGLTILVGLGFFFFAHAVVGHSDEAVVASVGHAQYMLMPVALAVGISLFPLTLMEATALALLPLLAFVAETLLFDGSRIWMFPGLAALLMCLIMLTTATSAMSQLALLKELFEKSAFDPLTRAVSRLAGTELLHILFEHSRRAGEPLSLLLLDLDRFKAVNDSYGHEAGDQLLREAVASVARRLRAQDAVIRWGGEELVIVLPNTNAEEAARLAAELCRHGLALRPDGAPQTASIGLAERIEDQAGHWRELVETADIRMYTAKTLGRSRLQGPATVALQLGAGGRAAAESIAADSVAGGAVLASRPAA
jgi:diguanylate cyclase (GGDEF)-like protein